MKSVRDNPISRSITTDILILLGVAAGVLLIPLMAMQFTAEVDWTLFDFVAAAALIVGIGTLYVFGARMVRTTRQRLVLGASLGLLLLVIWAELAVGIFH